MRKIYKLAAIGMAACLAMGSASTAYAGQWVKDNFRWWYRNSDGTWPENTWKVIDGKWYYFGDDGYMRANCTTPDGYIVGEDGAWIPAVPGNEKAVYEKFVFFKTIPIFDAADGYDAEYYIGDFNDDGIQDLFFTDIWRYEDFTSRSATQIYTIKGGKIVETDDLLHESNNASCGPLLSDDDGQIIISIFDGDLINRVLMLDDSLQMIDGNECDYEYEPSETNEWYGDYIELQECKFIPGYEWNKLTGEIISFK